MIERLFLFLNWETQKYTMSSYASFNDRNPSNKGHPKWMDKKKIQSNC